MCMQRKGVRPVLRWAGGKRRLVHRLAKLLPAGWQNYVEPMAGSAAMFFYLAPRKAVLADINPDLINFFRVLRDETSELVKRLNSLSASRDLYYEMRDNVPTSGFERAVRFAYLNRLCWNGVHRVNREGEFNVPIGDRLPRRLWNPDHLYRAASQLRCARLLRADFEETLPKLKKGDFSFVDPPYPRGAAKGLGFNRYVGDFFSVEDHKRLGKLLKILNERGVLLMVVMCSDPEILQFYPPFTRTLLRSKSLISGKPSSRRTVDEVVMTNYPMGK